MRGKPDRATVYAERLTSKYGVNTCVGNYSGSTVAITICVPSAVKCS